MIKKIILFAGIAILTTALCMAEVWKAPDQERAKERAKEVVPFIKEYKDDHKIARKMSLMDAGISMDDVQDAYFLMDSPIIKDREDHYGPVRFSHKRHANLTNDCSKCHHYRPKDEAASETTRCSACHQASFNPDYPERIGLKGPIISSVSNAIRNKPKDLWAARDAICRMFPIIRSWSSCRITRMHSR